MGISFSFTKIRIRREITSDLIFWALGLGLIFFPRAPFNFWGWHWYGRFWLILCSFALLFSVYVARRTSWWLWPFIVTMLLNSTSFAYPNPWYGLKWPEVTGLFSLANHHSATFFAYSVMAAWALAKAPRRWAMHLPRFASVSLWISIVLTHWEAVTLPFQRPTGLGYNGFVGNGSMNGCLMACLLPLAVSDMPRWSLFTTIATVSAVYATKSSVPIGVLAVVLLMAWRSGLILAMFPMGIYVADRLDEHLFNSSGRFEFWKAAWDWWNLNTPGRLFGTGGGTAQTLLPFLGMEKKVMQGAAFLWMHNDWFQLLFEHGYLGLVTGCIAFAYLCKRLWSSRAMFASLMGFAATGVFNYPTHLPIHWFFIFMLTVWALAEPDQRSPCSSIDPLF